MADDPRPAPARATAPEPAPALARARAPAPALARLYALLFPIPAVCFIAAVLTDVAYARTAFLMYLHFSEWLNAAGLAFGALAALVLLVEFCTGRRAIGWAHLLLFYAALVVELFNAFVHSIDGWTAVVPTGLTLSVVGALLVLAAGLLLRRARSLRWAEPGLRP